MGVPLLFEKEEFEDAVNAKPKCNPFTENDFECLAGTGVNTQQ